MTTLGSHLFFVIPAVFIAAVSPSAHKRSTEHVPKSSNSQYGWSYVNLKHTFGPGVIISGLASTSKGIIVTVTGTRSNGIGIQDIYASAPYDTQSGRLGSARNAAAPLTYSGPWQLNWNNAYNQKHIEGLQRVSIVRGGTQAAPWPKSVLIYGEVSQFQPSGAVDNQIIGKEGDWLWVAMKGPARPPFTLPEYFQFRNWNRIMAINLKTGAHRLYRIPPLTSETNSSNTPPAFAYHANKVFIGITDWLGVLPSTPTGAPSMASESANAIAVPIIRPVPLAMLRARWAVAETELSAGVRQEAGSIAFLWDHYVMDKNVRGVTGATFSWLTDGAYVNHGWIPQAILYGSEFPLNKGTASAKIQSMLLQQISLLGQNPLPSVGYLLNTSREVRQYFHGRPPTALPGYRIDHNLYVPDPSTWPLPPSFRTYTDAFSALGPLLAQASPYPVLIPTPSALDNIAPHWANVKYSVNQFGYNLQVYAGTKQSANAASIASGEANTDFILHAQDASKPLDANYQWNMNVTINNAKITRVNLGHGIIGTIDTESAKDQQRSEQSVSWREGGWTWGIQAGNPADHLVAQAKQEVKSLFGLPLPAPSGQGVFSMGSDAPSQIEFTGINARYVLYATGWRAPQLGASLVDLSSY